MYYELALTASVTRVLKKVMNMDGHEKWALLTLFSELYNRLGPFDTHQVYVVGIRFRPRTS